MPEVDKNGIGRMVIGDMDLKIYLIRIGPRSVFYHLILLVECIVPTSEHKKQYSPDTDQFFHSLSVLLSLFPRPLFLLNRRFFFCSLRGAALLTAFSSCSAA